jgi:hypothetical protein
MKKNLHQKQPLLLAVSSSLILRSCAEGTLMLVQVFFILFIQTNSCLDLAASTSQVIEGILNN